MSRYGSMGRKYSKICYKTWLENIPKFLVMLIATNFKNESVSLSVGYRQHNLSNYIASVGIFIVQSERACNLRENQYILEVISIG